MFFGPQHLARNLSRSVFSLLTLNKEMPTGWGIQINPLVSMSTCIKKFTENQFFWIVTRVAFISNLILKEKHWNLTGRLNYAILKKIFRRMFVKRTWNFVNNIWQFSAVCTWSLRQQLDSFCYSLEEILVNLIPLTMFSASNRLFHLRLEAVTDHTRSHVHFT